MSTRKTSDPRKWLREQVEQIRARRDLSEEGKVAHIGRVYEQAREAFTSQNRQAAEEWEDGYRSRLRPLVAPKQYTPEWRALRDEALTIKDAASARRRLETALTTGDTLEAHAIGAAALDKASSGMPGTEAWVEVVNLWGSSDSSIDTALTELSDYRATKPSSSERLFSNAFPQPAELSKNPNWRTLTGIADDPDRADLTPTARKAANDMDITFRGSRGTPEIS